MHTRSVLVTGTSSGIGRATALTLAAEGYRVFAGVRRSMDGESLVHSAQRYRGQIVPLVVDVTDAASIDNAAGVVAPAVGGGGLAGLVNNAGIGVTGPVEAIPLDELRRVYEVNVLGQVAVT